MSTHDTPGPDDVTRPQPAGDPTERIDSGPEDAPRIAASSPDAPLLWATPRPDAEAPPVWSARTAPVERPRGPRSGTLILGLVLAVCGAAAVVVALGYRIDLQLTLIALLLLAAVTLLLTPLLRRGRERAGGSRT